LSFSFLSNSIFFSFAFLNFLALFIPTLKLSLIIDNVWKQYGVVLSSSARKTWTLEGQVRTGRKKKKNIYIYIYSTSQARGYISVCTLKNYGGLQQWGDRPVIFSNKGYFHCYQSGYCNTKCKQSIFPLELPWGAPVVSFPMKRKIMRFNKDKTLII
jgi:hypothetical protein